MDFYKLTEKEVFKQLKTDEKGLTSSEAKSRLDEYGPNKIESKKKISPLMIFLQQFNNPVVWVLIGAAIISAILGEIVDLYVILAILIANAVIGFKQEYNAEQAIEALKKMASLKTIVIRDGVEREVDAEELVPGDVINLIAGEKVPADARLFFINNLECQEAALTGESVPVSKKILTYDTKLEIGDQKNMVFSGTIITGGKAKAIVVKTGMKTEIGKIAELLESSEEIQTPLQVKMEKLGKVITYIVLGISVIIFSLLYLRKTPILHSLETAAALAVAAIPEGLAVVVTVSLALGVKKMVKKNALVRKLPSVETLGSTTVICSDKTGTLTKNEMTVKKIFVDNQIIDVSGSGYETEGNFSKHTKDLELLLQIGLLNNDAKLEKTDKGYKVLGDPTEGSLIVSAKKAGFNYLKLNDEYPRVDELLFTSERKRMTTIHKAGKNKVAYVKGAPDIILELCSSIIIDGKIQKITPAEKKKILAANDAFSKNALRVLGFAYKDISSEKNKDDFEKSLTFVGLQAMIDPPREEVKASIKKCKTAGIKVVMITGDHLGTAEAIARELGIEGKSIQGKDIDKINLDKEVEKISIYARVNPEHKMKIVKALQKKGHVVAMTGDGVNDAPALKASDIGIAMGISGTDVAKESSDMILTDDNFTSIVNAVEEGRGVYDNIRKYVAFLISGNIGEILVILLAILVGLPAPLVATQILLINLVTDGLPALALSADPYEPGALSRKPRKKNESIFKGLKAFIFYYPAIMTAVSIGVFYWFLTQTANLARAQTATFFSIGMFELYQAFSCRSIRYPSFKVGLFKNKYLVLAVLSSLSILAVIVFIPTVSAFLGMATLTIREFFTLILLASTGSIVIEITKALKSAKEDEY